MNTQTCFMSLSILDLSLGLRYRLKTIRPLANVSMNLRVGAMLAAHRTSTQHATSENREGGRFVDAPWLSSSVSWSMYEVVVPWPWWNANMIGIVPSRYSSNTRAICRAQGKCKENQVGSRMCLN